MSSVPPPPAPPPHPPRTTPPFRLDNLIAVVTGAGSQPPPRSPELQSETLEIGNGRAISILLARQGAKVALFDIKPEWARETKKVIDEEGGVSEVFECDVTNEESCRRAIENVVGLWGGEGLKVLVNSVGVSGAPGTVLTVSLEGWERTLRVNLTSMVIMSRVVIPYMHLSPGGGSIINISSVSGIRSGHPSVLYPTAKGAVIQLTRAMAAHHGREGIRVNTVAPGMVYTPMVAIRGMTPQIRSARAAQSLLGTEGTAFDTAYAVLFLASRESRWITGACLPVDGGVTAGNPARPALPGEGEYDTEPNIGLGGFM